MAWDDAKKAKVVEMYQSREPTAENSMEIVAEIGEEVGETANGVRMILIKAKDAEGNSVYIKKAEGAKSTASSGGAAKKEGGTARVSKEDSHNALIAAIEAHGGTADTEIVSKMTGKAAQHFTALFNAITPAE